MLPAHPTISASIPRALRAAGLALGGLVVAAQGGCFFSDQGLSPPSESFYFPTGLVTSPGRTALYVANSDFDLQYNGGTVQILDLAALRGSIATVLAGVRCAQGVGCATIADLQTICRSIPMSLPGADAGGPCKAATDCVRGACVIGSDGENGTCQAVSQSDCASGVFYVGPDSVHGTCAPCNSSADCLGNGFCECAGTGEGCNGTCKLDLATNQILTPAACTPLLPPFRGFNSIGAFASGAVVAKNNTPGQGARLFVPVRGDPSITWFDIADDRVENPPSPFQLQCGASLGGSQRCDDSHRMGVDPYDNFRDLTLPVEPVGLDIGDDTGFGNPIVTAHQIANAPAVGLSLNGWRKPGSTVTKEPAAPLFEYYLTGVAAGPVDVARIPPPAIVGAANMLDQPGFLVTYNATPEVDIVRVDYDQLSNPPRPFLQLSAKAAVTVNAGGSDSRGAAVDPTKRQACERACNQTDLVCLGNCVNIPLDVYIANRTPPTLLLGEIQSTLVQTTTQEAPGCSAMGATCAKGTDCCSGACDAGVCGAGPASAIFDVLQLYSSLPVSVGVSGVVIGNVLGLDGALHSNVFVVCFDTRFIYAYDPANPGLPLQPIHTGRGPNSIAFDACCDPGVNPSCTTPCGPNESPHAYLIVGHFTDSYLGVVDLDLGHATTTFGTMFASIGVPQAPPETM